MNPLPQDLWYVSRGEQTLGPYVHEQLVTLWRNGTLTAADLIAAPGDAQWIPLVDVMRRLESDRSRTTALVLCLCLGWCGGHRFYLGLNATAYLFLILLFTAPLGPGAILVVWWLVDLIRIAAGSAQDAQARRVTHW